MKKIFKRIKRWHIIVFTSIIVVCLSCLSIWCFYKYEEKYQLVEINLYDEVQKIYNGLIKAGYTVIGTEEEFRKNIADIDNRKELYDMVSANGDVKLGSFDYFSKRIDYALYSSIKEDTSQSLQSKNIRERHRQLYNDLSKYYKVNGSFEEFKKWFIVYENRKICYQWLKQKQTITPIAFDKKYAISSCSAWYYIANEIMQDDKIQRKVYNNLSSRYTDISSFENFQNDLKDEKKRKKIYDAVKNDYSDIGSYELFSSKILSATPKTSPTSEVGSVANKNMQDNVTQLYNGLRKKGYTQEEIGDEKQFREYISSPKNRKEFYDMVVANDDFIIGDYETYEKRLAQDFPPISEVKKNGIRQLYEVLDVKYDFNEFKEELSTLSGKEKAYKSLPWYYKENLDWFGFITKYELVPRVADINPK
ncbi:MAG: hypothetical protein UH077_01440 [Bacteroidales bacterium]|nr:hypothetical protein [Bacteroidales bacterium]